MYASFGARSHAITQRSHESIRGVSESEGGSERASAKVCEGQGERLLKYLKEEHGIIVGDVEESAEIGLRLTGNTEEFLASMAHLHYAHATGRWRRIGRRKGRE